MVSIPRIIWLDWLKFFAIFLVVWGHALLHLGNIPELNKYSGVCGFIYSFHMPLFMTISGFFSYKLVIGQGNLQKKIVQLILPCITLAIICFLIEVYDQNFWYLKSLFLCYTFFYFYFKVQIKEWKKIIICLVLFFLLFPLLARIPYLRLYKIDFMLPFFGLGLFLFHIKDYVYKNSTFLLVILASVFIVLELFWNESYLWYNSFPNWINYKHIYIEKSFSFDIFSIYSYMYRFVIGAIGSLFFFILFFVISNKITLKASFFSFLRNNILGYTMQIYILQTFLVQINLLEIQFPVDNMFLYQYVYTFFFSLVIVLLCIAITKVLEKSKLVSLLFFGINQYK